MPRDFIDSLLEISFFQVKVSNISLYANIMWGRLLPLDVVVCIPCLRATGSEAYILQARVRGKRRDCLIGNGTQPCLLPGII